MSNDMEDTGNPRATYYGDAVRQRTDNTWPDQPYEVVETQRFTNHWIEVRRFGHMSDDYALSNARRLAQSLARTRIGGT